MKYLITTDGGVQTAQAESFMYSADMRGWGAVINEVPHLFCDFDGTQYTVSDTPGVAPAPMPEPTPEPEPTPQ